MWIFSLHRKNCKGPSKQNNPQGVQETNPSNSVVVSDPAPGHSRYSVLSTEGVFCDSVTSMEGTFSHSVLPAEENLQLPMEDRSPMHCASIQQTAESGDTGISLNTGSTKPSLSITDIPLIQNLHVQMSSKVLEHSKRSLQIEIET